ncbi:MAG: hypothetical protein IJ518_08190 [Clostridia bacterium]|nr:hypothetical protein [Clostridia bacterium]
MSKSAKKKSPVWGIVIAVVLLLTVVFCWPEGEEPSPLPGTEGTSGTEQQTTETAINGVGTTMTTKDTFVKTTKKATTTTKRVPTTASDLPGLAATYNSHPMLQCRKMGACSTLTGKVMLTMVMVDDDNGAWTEAALADYKQAQNKATDRLLADAKRYGVQLDISIRYIRCKTTGSVNMTTYNEWSARALKAAGLGDSSTLIPRLKKQYGVKEAPVMFCVNYTGRAFSIEWNQPEYFEYAVFYSTDADYRHELCHLFGATDLYSPAVVKQAAEKHIPKSVMISSEYGVDSLTAYLMGWTDSAASDMQAFLSETAWLTKEYLDEEGKKEIYTGYVTNRRVGSGVYTGNLVEGGIQGKGKMVWDNGDVYEGDWVGGVYHGHGTITWASGSTYTGQFDNGVVNGKGKMVWNNGDVYEGDWVNAAYHGQGTLVWASGAKYTGDWRKGTMHGYGTYVSAEGDVFTGRWENGEYKG